MVYMISQPMRGVDRIAAQDVHMRVKQMLEADGHTVVETISYKIFEDEDVQNAPLFLLANVLRQMSKCDAVYFCKGWRSARGCRVEYLAAQEYGLIIEEEDGGT